MNLKLGPYCRDHDPEKSRDRIDEEDESCSSGPNWDETHSNALSGDKEVLPMCTASLAGSTTATSKSVTVTPKADVTQRVLDDQALNRQAPTFSDSDIEDTDWNDLNDLESMARQTAGLNESESVKTLSKDQNAMESDTNESSFQRDMISNSTPPESNPNFQEAQPENPLDGEVADAAHGQLDEYQEESEMVELIQDDDCIIMDDSFSTCTPANSDDKVKETHHIQDTLEDKDEEDVIILQAEGDFTHDLPHLRESCPRHPFNTKQAMHACKNCFCMVCDINWSECKKWSTHCKAKFGDPKWIAERNKAKCGFDDKTIKKHLKDIFDSIEDFSKATKRSIRQELERRLGTEEGRLECRKNEISEWIMEHLDRL